MYGRHVAQFRRGLIAFDAVVSMVAFVVAYFLRHALVRLAQSRAGIEFEPITDTAVYGRILIALPFVWGVALYLNDTNDFRSSYVRITVRYARAIALGLGLLVAASFLFKVHQLARTFVVLFGAVNLVFLILGRLALMETIAVLRRKKVDGHRLLIVGCGERAITIAKALNTQPPWNIKLLGFVPVPGEERRVFFGGKWYSGHVDAAPQLGDIEDLAHILDSQPVDEVLFSVPDLEEGRLVQALNACDERGVDVLLPLPPALPTHSKVEIANLAGAESPLLGLRRTPTGDARLAVKRALDILGAGVMLLFAAPIMLVVAAAVKLTSPGPILFRQTRSGRSGRKFTMLKFRSMGMDAEERRKELVHLNELSGPVFKIQRDPRLTSIGSFIRRTSLDELPQIFNILAGDMSLVGPRPPLPTEVEEYEPWQRRRLSVKPGLTGLWQVSGRNDIDFDEWMALDLSYIDNWSLWLDVKILLRTVPAVVLKSGAS